MGYTILKEMSVIQALYLFVCSFQGVRDTLQFEFLVQELPSLNSQCPMGTYYNKQVFDPQARLGQATLRDWARTPPGPSNQQIAGQIKAGRGRRLKRRAVLSTP